MKKGMNSWNLQVINQRGNGTQRKDTKSMGVTNKFDNQTNQNTGVQWYNPKNWMVQLSLYKQLCQKS
jgi:hypothetical protein